MIGRVKQGEPVEVMQALKGLHCLAHSSPRARKVITLQEHIQTLRGCTNLRKHIEIQALEALESLVKLELAAASDAAELDANVDSLKAQLSQLKEEAQLFQKGLKKRGSRLVQCDRFRR